MLTRRQFCGAAAATFLLDRNAAFAAIRPSGVPPQLLERAKASFDFHRSQFIGSGVIAIVDFGAPSHEARLHIVDMARGRRDCLLVAHGRGSDPAHSGWVERFSNVVGSEASSAGAYLTGEIYRGKHGLSRRLRGLDPSNSNAESRGIVIHAADYVSAERANSGKIGRSEGCLAVAPQDIGKLLSRLGPGSLIYVGKA